MNPISISPVKLTATFEVSHGIIGDWNWERALYGLPPLLELPVDGCDCEECTWQRAQLKSTP